MIKILKTLFIFLGLSICLPAFGQSNDSTYEYLTNVSAKIARGKIISKTEVKYDYKGETLTCGWLLDIAVSESWKGGNDNFTVLSTRTDILIDDNLDYFIFARRNNEYNPARSTVNYVDCDGFNTAKMDVSSFPYYATSLKQQIFPIITYTPKDNIVDPDTNIVKTGDWMVIVNRLSNPYLPFTIRRRRLNTDNENIIEEMKLTDFITEFMLR